MKSLVALTFIFVVLMMAVVQEGVDGQGSSLPDYYKNGTYCTTFLNTQKPLTDSPCQNGGICDADTLTCDCQDGWINNATLGYYDCRVKQCLQGEGPNPLNNKCECQPGWSGYQCEYCESNEACENAGLEEVDPVSGNVTRLTLCDNTYYTKKRKAFKCKIYEPYITQVIGSEVSIQCQNISFPNDGTNFENGVCTFQSWSNTSSNLPSGYEVNALQCSMYGCSGELSATDSNYVAYYCETTRCTCSGLSAKCDVDIQAFIHSMLGWSKIQCNRRTQKCLMGQRALGTITVEMDCAGAECVAEPIPDPPKPKNEVKTKGIIAGSLLGLGVVLLIIAAVTVFAMSLVHTKQLTAEWNRIKDLSVGATIQCSNLRYSVTKRDWMFRPQRKIILDNVSCTIRPGRLVALLGESGSGKTTLLDILAKRNKSGTLSGSVKANDISLKKWNGYKRLSAYVSQDDRLMGTLTVRESLMFAADLKLPSCVSYKEKQLLVEEVLQRLSIDHVADRRIGTATRRGISGGEKRRVSIAMELVHNPQVLFLDEPTSGLDAASAQEVCQYLKDMTLSGRTVVLSIHQPRSNIFTMFDDIILMSQGSVAYTGPAKNVVNYFQTVTGKQCPESYNPADYLLDVIFDARKRKEKLVMKSTEELVQLEEKQIDTVSDSTSSGDEKPLELELKDTVVDEQQIHAPIQSDELQVKESACGTITELSPYATSFTSQLRVLSRRSFFNFIRNFFLFPTHIVGAIVLGIILGAIFSGKLSTSLQDTQTKVGIFFIEMFVLSFICLSSIEIFMAEREVYVRELSNNYYYTSPYFLSKVMFDILPLRIIPPILIVAISYYWAGLHPSVGRFFWNMFFMVLFNIGSGALCIMVGSVAPGVGAANIVTILIIIFFILFAGFPANRQSLSPVVRWLTYVSFWAYPLEGIVVNEFVGTKVNYRPEGIDTTYVLPGETVLNILGFDRTRFYVDIVVTGVYGFAMLLLSGVLLKVFVREKR